MLKILYTYFIGIVLLQCLLIAQSHIPLTSEEKDFLQKNTPLRLHNELNWPPFNFYEGGEAKGFSIDYFNLLAQKLDIEVQYITGPTWDEFIQMLQEDKIDAIINISKNEERAKTIAFTSIFHTAANAIYVKKGNESLDSLEKLEGKTVVMPKGFFAQKALEKYYPKINQILVKDSLEALQLLSLGKADATIGKKNVLDYVITLNNISGLVPINYVDDNRMVSLIRIGTSKQKTLLRDILEKAQKSISDEELLNLKRKWFGVQDIIPKKENGFFNEEEKEYILQKKRIKMCNHNDLKPIEFLLNGEFQGISIDIIKLLENISGLNFISVPTHSLSQSKLFLKSHQCDIIPTVTNSGELIGDVHFTKPYLNYKMAIVTQKEEPVVSSLENILDKTMAIKEGSTLIGLLKSINPNIKFYYTKNDRETLEAVSNKKAYFALEPLPVASYYISTYALNNLYISRYTNFPYTVNMAVNMDESLLLTILNKSINQISQTQHREIFNKWTSTPVVKSITQYEYFWEFILAIVLFILIIIYRNYVVEKHNIKLKLAKEEIEHKTKQLARQKVLFETLYTKSSDGVLLLKDGIVNACNESTLTILKYKEHEIINKRLEELSPLKQNNSEPSKQKVQQMLDVALQKGANKFEWIFFDAAKNPLWVEVVLTSIIIEENNRVIHMVIRDISNRKILEQKLEDLNNNLEQRIKEEIKKNEINTQQLIQQSRLAQMGEMISMIAHQWRQPLAAVSATTNNLLIKLLLHDKVDKEYFEHELKLVSDYSLHLSSTIDDFRNFFKSNKEKSTFSMVEIIQKSLNIIQTSIEANNIQLITNFQGDAILFSYSGEIQQVILNILKNSEDILVEQKKRDKIIAIDTCCRQENIIIKISDNAGGIDESIMCKIFDPYFSTKNSKDGTGLGLYMSKIIIHDHCNGSLKVCNENGGASFTITLPLNSQNGKKYE